jgi:hypothetical protein
VSVKIGFRFQVLGASTNVVSGVGVQVSGSIEIKSEISENMRSILHLSSKLQLAIEGPTPDTCTAPSGSFEPDT